MSHQISQSEWKRMAASIDGSVQHANAQQQRLFRLFQALRANDLEMATRLIEDGAPIDMPLKLREKDGGPPRAEQFRFEELEDVVALTALGYAAGRGEYDHVKWLIRHQATINAPFSRGRDAAWIAMEMGQTEVLEILLNAGIIVDQRLSDGSDTTRLIAATKLSNLDAVSLLIEKKARINAFDARGRTALHYNFEKDPYAQVDVEIGRMLIDWGGTPAAVDLEGTSPADLAHTDIQYALLRQYGLEKKLNITESPVSPKEPAPVAEEDFDQKKIVRPEAGDPGLPQLAKVPVFKKPRF